MEILNSLIELHQNYADVLLWDLSNYVAFIQKTCILFCWECLHNTLEILKISRIFCEMAKDGQMSDTPLLAQVCFNNRLKIYYFNISKNSVWFPCQPELTNIWAIY
jgi:hypothetical protein